jgi:hypothetical protein
MESRCRGEKKIGVFTFCGNLTSRTLFKDFSNEKDENINLNLWMSDSTTNIRMFIDTAMKILKLKLIAPFNLSPTFTFELPKTPTIYLKIENSCLIQNMNLFSFEFYFGAIRPSNDYTKLSCNTIHCKYCINIVIKLDTLYIDGCNYKRRYDNYYHIKMYFSPYKSINGLTVHSSVYELTTAITTVTTTSLIMYSKQQLLSSTSVNAFASKHEEINHKMNTTTLTTSITKNTLTTTIETKSLITDSIQNESQKWKKSVCTPFRLVDCVKCYIKKKCLYRNPYCFYTTHSKPYESLNITENESFIINLKTDAKINLNFYIRTNISSELLVYVSSPRNLTLFFNIIPATSDYNLSFSEIFYVEYLDGSFTSVYSFLINTDNENFVNYETILCVDYKVCRFSSTNNTHLQINHTNLFLSNVEHNETLNNNINNLYLQFQDVNFTILYGINSDSLVNGFFSNLTKLTKILLFSGILSIVFIFIVMSTILFYCKVLKPKRKVESPNKPQLTEMITPELSMPEVLSQEIVTPEIVAQEIVAPEIGTLEVVAPEIITTEEEAYDEGEPEILEKPPMTVIVLNIDSSKIDQKVFNINIEMKQ